MALAGRTASGRGELGGSCGQLLQAGDGFQCSTCRFGALLREVAEEVVLVLVVFVAVGAIGLVVSRSVLRQIGGEPNEAIGIMSEVAQGNLDTPIPPSPPGSMLDGLAHMVASLRKLVTEVRTASDSAANSRARSPAWR